MKQVFLFYLAAVLAVTNAPSASAKPLVMTSLKPLSLIAQEITGTAAEVETLLPVTASHHDYPLKMSDHVRLQKADVFLWVGPELESFLQKPLANLPQAKVIAAYDLAGIHWPAEQHGHADDHHEHDPHLWLDPHNAVIVAQALTKKLVQVDAANANQYRANLASFVVKAERLDKALGERLKPLAGLGFAVYHEGFGHFVSRYNLHQLDYVAFTPEQKPGAKHMQQLRTRLAKEGRCLFIEPYGGDMTAMQNLAQELHLKVGTLDAFGALGAKDYSHLLEQMASAFSACLANPSN